MIAKDADSMILKICGLSEATTHFAVDPLAYAVASHRTNSVGLTSAQPTIEDYLKATDIRNYYSKKFLWNSLNDKATDYQQTALRLLTVDSSCGWNITEREQGLFVKLPWFYEEDQAYDELKQLVNSEDYVNDVVVTQLTYFKKTITWRGSTKKIRIWLKDNANRIYSVTSMPGNPFTDFFEDFLQIPRMLECSVNVVKTRGFCFYNIKTFKVSH